jgi:SAM-dependent methyltransferase
MSRAGGRWVAGPLARAFWGVYGRLAWDRVAADARRSVIGSLMALLDGAASRSGDLVLDAGCGTGGVAIALARAGYRVVAADAARGMLRVLERKLRVEPGLSVTVARADLRARWPWEEARFDHVVLVSVLQLLPRPEHALAECARVLRPGGCCIVAQGRRAAAVATGPTGDPWLRSLTAAKRLADRRAGVPHWSVRELSALLRAAGLEPAGVSAGEMTAVVGRRPAPAPASR